MTSAPPSTPTVLLVEDNALVQDLIETTLSDEGYGLRLCDNGPEAIACLETEATHVCALVTDVNLGPGPTGWDVARHARTLNPHLPVVFISGDSAHQWMAQEIGNSEMIAKPFLISDLVAAVDKLCRGPRD